MSEPEPGQVPPAGEEIHLPGASWQPILLAFGIMVAIVGITTSPFLCAAGVILTVAVIVRWIRDTRRDIAELPADHSAH
jgi:hypothetical protein